MLLIDKIFTTNKILRNLTLFIPLSNPLSTLFLSSIFNLTEQLKPLKNFHLSHQPLALHSPRSFTKNQTLFPNRKFKFFQIKTQKRI